MFERLVEDSVQRRKLQKRGEEVEQEKEGKRLKKQHFLDLYSRLMALEQKKQRLLEQKRNHKQAEELSASSS